MRSLILSIVMISITIVVADSVDCRTYMGEPCQGYVGGLCCVLDAAPEGEDPSVYCAPGAEKYILQLCDLGQQCTLEPTWTGSRYVNVPICVCPYAKI
jgi:hypothetical protein